MVDRSFHSTTVDVAHINDFFLTLSVFVLTVSFLRILIFLAGKEISKWLLLSFISTVSSLVDFSGKSFSVVVTLVMSDGKRIVILAILARTECLVLDDSLLRLKLIFFNWFITHLLMVKLIAVKVIACLFSAAS